MAHFYEYDDLISQVQCEALLAEAIGMESLVGADKDPWALQVCAGDTRGSEPGGTHTIHDPMYNAVIERHREDPTTQGNLCFWYHHASTASIEAATGRTSALAAISADLSSYSKRARIAGDLNVELSDANVLSLKLTRFAAGAFLSPHTDFDKEEAYAASIVLFLNKDWHPYLGGQLWVQTTEGWKSILPCFGTAVCFVPNSDSNHFVQMINPVAPSPRYAVTGWFLT